MQLDLVFLGLAIKLKPVLIVMVKFDLSIIYFIDLNKKYVFRVDCSSSCNKLPGVRLITAIITLIERSQIIDRGLIRKQDQVKSRHSGQDKQLK